MRIIYGVFGYGRGHATRALAVLPALARQHEVLVLAGGDAHELLQRDYRVIELPRMGYVYGPTGRHSLIDTLTANAYPLADALFEGNVARSLRRKIEVFRPQVAVSDAEPFTHHVAERLSIPRVSFDHIGMLAHCRVDVPEGYRWAMARDVSTYLLMMGRADSVIVSSFFPAEPRRSNVRVVGPLLRPGVKYLTAHEGDYLLAYFNRGQHQLSARIEAELQGLGMPVVMYGSDLREKRGAIDFRPPSDAGFLRDLAGCRAMVSTAGNQLVGECIHFKKPMLVVPENCLEQEINARAVERLGIGRRVSARDLDGHAISQFLRDHGEWAHALAALAAHQAPDALATLERSLFEVAPRARTSQMRSWRYA